MHIPFFNLLKHHQSIKEEIEMAFKKVIHEDFLIGGKSVEKFENSFSGLLGVKHCISVGNGTDAIFISLKSLNIGKGDEVITVANGWISASECISLTGASPVFVDIDPIYDSIDVNQLLKAINNKTKAIILTHFQGQMCAMDEIIKIANLYQLPIIEDCAQAHFATYKNNFSGSFGISACYSFYPTKNLGAYGDAGCIVTDDDEFAKKLRLFARHGSLIKGQHEIEGINSRMDSLQAAFLNVKLNYVDKWVHQRRTNANLYQEGLANLDFIQLPKERQNTKHAYHLYVIKTKYRDELKDFLSNTGIETLIHYPIALPFLKAYAHRKFTVDDFPITYEYQQKCLSLPIYPELQIEEIEYICSQIHLFFKNIHR